METRELADKTSVSSKELVDSVMDAELIRSIEFNPYYILFHFNDGGSIRIESYDDRLVVVE